MKRKNILMSVSVVLSLVGMCCSASNTEQPENDRDLSAVMINTNSFSGWTLVDMEMRKEKDKYVKIENGMIIITANSCTKDVWFFYPKAQPCKNGGIVEFNFIAEGTGKGWAGFFAYESERDWNVLSGTSEGGSAISTFPLKDGKNSYSFTFKVKGSKTKAVRLMVGATPGSEVKFSELKINIK